MDSLETLPVLTLLANGFNYINIKNIHFDIGHIEFKVPEWQLHNTTDS